MEELERLHKAEGLEFNSLWACLRCMPHTVHLSALEVHYFIPYFTIRALIVILSCVQMLKAIGVIKESKKGAEKPYQDSVMAPLDREDERDIDEKEDDGEDGDWEDEDEEAPSSAILGKVLPAIGKVHAI